MNHLVKAAPVVIAGLVSFCVSAAPPESALVESAIAAEVTTSDQNAIRQKLNASSSRLAERIAKNANEQVGGVVVFARGLEPKEVAQFAETHRLEVTRAEAKVPAGTADIVHTFSFGAESLFFLDGPLDERLEKLVGRQRGMFMASSQAPDASDAAELREAAYSHQIRFYKIEVVGPASSFDAMQKGGETAAVFVDESTARVEQLTAQQATAARMRSPTRLVIKGRPYADGPPPGVRVTPENQPRVFSPFPVAPPDRPAQQRRSSENREGARP